MLKERQSHFKMIPASVPTLPELWLSRIGMKSWPAASVTVGAAFYLLLLALASIDDQLAWLRAEPGWHSLIYPVMTTYLLLVQPVMRNLLCDSVAAFQPLLPAPERSALLVTQALALNRRQEWAAFLLGATAGWLLIHPWGFASFWLMMYGFVVGGLNFGLLGWFIYSALKGTQFLTALHNQTRGLDVRTRALSTLSRWSIGVGLALLGGVVLSVLSFSLDRHFPVSSLLVYGLLVSLVAFIFLQGATSSSLSTHFRILKAFVLLFIVALLGTLGYHRLEGWPLLDGLYMTVITMTTIGFREVAPLSQMGKTFTIFLGLASVGIAGYTISAVAAFIVEGDFQNLIRGRKMKKEIDKLRNHIILCGAGRVGLQSAIEFHKTKTPFIVVEQDQEALEEALRLGAIPYVQGDATKDETLLLAGIERAKGIVVALRDDKDNAFVTLSARSMNPNLRIVARLTNEENAAKLRKVGADSVVSTNVIGGLRMASLMIRPSVVTFLDEMLRVTGQTLRMEEVTVRDGDGMVGKTLVEADIGRKTGLLVVAIKRREGGYEFNPRGGAILQDDDILIVIGTPEQMAALRLIEERIVNRQSRIRPDFPAP